MIGTNTRQGRSIRIAALFFAMMASGGNLIVPRELWVVLTLVASLIALRGRPPMAASRMLIYVWITLVTLLLMVLYGQDQLISTLSRLAIFVSALLLLEIYLAKGAAYLRDDLLVILKLMALQAIATSVIGNVAPSIFSTIDVGGLIYHHLGFVLNFHFAHNVPTSFIRPNGFFYEPGVFQFYLALFLYICLFWKRDLTWAAIGLVALLTTLSTIGLMAAVFLLLAAAISLSQTARGAKVVASLVIIIGAMPFVAFIAINNASAKFHGEDRGSFVARQYDLFTGLNLIQAKPLTGIGFDSDSYLFHSAKLGYAATGLDRASASERLNTNGIVQIFYAIGIPLGLPLFIAIFRQVLLPRRYIVAVILLLSLSGQSLAYSVFFMFILFSGMLVRNKRASPRRQVAPQ